MRRAVEGANERIFIQSRDNQSERGMGTTCTAAALVDDTLVVGQIGDSRCYVLRDGKLAQVTKDQSLAWQLIEAGAMTAEEAKAFEHANIILQALGVQERVEVVLSQVELRQGDVVAALLGRPARTGRPTRRCWRCCVASPICRRPAMALIQKALDRDGPDNITVVLARFDGEGADAARRRGRRRFVGYDPGSDPVPRADVVGRTTRAPAARRSRNGLPQRAAVRRGRSPTKADAGTSRTVRAPARVPASRGARTARRCWRSSSWRWWRRRRAGSS